MLDISMISYLMVGVGILADLPFWGIAMAFITLVGIGIGAFGFGAWRGPRRY